MSDVNDFLQELRPWLVGVSRRFTRDPGTQSDLAQEGWIAAWKAARKAGPEGDLAAFMKQAAFWRMTDVFLNQNSFGHRRAHSTVIKPVLVNVFDDDDERFGSLASYFELAYHHGEINRAVDELPSRQREYVRLRFWGGYEYSQLLKHFGYVPTTLWAGARQKLREVLRHLEDD